MFVYDIIRSVLFLIFNFILDGSDGKESACKAGDPSSISESGRHPGARNGKPLQYSCLENPVDRAAWWAAVHEVAKSWTRLK